MYSHNFITLVRYFFPLFVGRFLLIMSGENRHEQTPSVNLSSSPSTICYFENKEAHNKYVFITKKRLKELEYIETNLSTIIHDAVLKSETNNMTQK